MPRSGPTINGQEITPLGFSVVPFLILIGLGVLYLFGAWENRLERLGRDRLLDFALLRIVPLRAGLSTLAVQQLVILGTFFVLPVYLQVVLGLDAFETGLRLVPMSVAMLIAALSGPRLAAAAVAARGRPARAGRGRRSGAVVVLATLDVELNASGSRIGLAIFGIGAGLLASQLGNVIMSAAPPAQTNEAGGLQGTAQNLGASLGTALIGAVLLHRPDQGFARPIEEDRGHPRRHADAARCIGPRDRSRGRDRLRRRRRGDGRRFAARPGGGGARPVRRRPSCRACGWPSVPWRCSRSWAWWFTRRLPAGSARGGPGDDRVTLRRPARPIPSR